MERISLLQPANTAASRQVPEKHLRLEPKNSILMTSVYPEFTTSCIISIIGFVWVKMADSVTRWCFYAAFHAEKHSEVMPEFWAVWCHQYEIFRIESQALQEATSNMYDRAKNTFAHVSDVSTASRTTLYVWAQLRESFKIRVGYSNCA